MTQIGHSRLPYPDEAHRPAVVISRGLRPEERAEAARQFWDAFSGKLSPILNPPVQAHAYLMRSLRLENALCARDPDGRLCGVAGIKTTAGGLLSGTWSDLTEVYGLAGALWRGPLLDLTSRAAAPDQMVLDGLFVDAALRGQGTGSALIAAFLTEARNARMTEVRLDVAGSNPRARALYLRHGFRGAGASRMGLLRLFLGFRTMEHMVRIV